MFLPSVTAETLAAAAAQLSIGKDEVLLVLLAEDGCPDLEAVVRALAEVEIKFFGGVFPGLIDGKKEARQGALLLRLPANDAPYLITGLESSSIELPDLSSISACAPGSHTAIVLVDGLTANVSRLLTDLHARLGSSVNYIGGGAGSLSLRQQPCVFSSRGVFQDAAIVAFIPQRCRLGVRHGWGRYHGPVVATHTRGNVIVELNWRAAFDVYREAVEPHLEAPLTAENFFVASTAFPFGIHKEGCEDVVRDPVGLGPAGELICVGEVPENAVLDILHGDRETLIAAAAQAGDDLCASGPVKIGTALVIDCVSRTMFLESDFERELGMMSERIASLDAGIRVQGALTLGEISSHGAGTVEFLNKTIVAAVLHD